MWTNSRMCTVFAGGNCTKEDSSLQHNRSSCIFSKADKNMVHILPRLRTKMSSGWDYKKLINHHPPTSDIYYTHTPTTEKNYSNGFIKLVIACVHTPRMHRVVFTAGD